MTPPSSPASSAPRSDAGGRLPGVPDAATVLVLNSGSSSLKFQLLDPVAEVVHASGIVDLTFVPPSPCARAARR